MIPELVLYFFWFFNVKFQQKTRAYTNIALVNEPTSLSVNFIFSFKSAFYSALNSSTVDVKISE